MLSPQQRAVIEFWAQFMRGSAPSFHELYCDSLYVSGGPFSVREVLVAQVFT